MYIIRKKEKRAFSDRKRPGDDVADLKAGILCDEVLEEPLRDLSEAELRAIAAQDHVTEIDIDAWNALTEEKRKRRKAPSQKSEK